ncbi:RNA polymerase subunit sigma-70 [Clostridioides difficile]|nr:RNA polymerase subunit sigma-70 [Clostridioides difficile]
MNTSSFEHIIRLQFNTLMMIVIKGKMKHYKKRLSKRSMNEVLFCEMSEAEQIEHGIFDTYSYIYMSFEVFNFTICVSDEKLAIALNMLSEKQRNIILLRYFQDMNDREIAELYHVSRSAISSMRNRGLKKLEMILTERN